MIVFQVSLNFEPMKEILEIRGQIYILLKKSIILIKIEITNKHSLHHFSIVAV